MLGQTPGHVMFDLNLTCFRISKSFIAMGHEASASHARNEPVSDESGAPMSNNDDNGNGNVETIDLTAYCSDDSGTGSDDDVVVIVHTTVVLDSSDVDDPGVRDHDVGDPVGVQDVDLQEHETGSYDHLDLDDLALDLPKDELNHSCSPDPAPTPSTPTSARWQDQGCGDAAAGIGLDPWSALDSQPSSSLSSPSSSSSSRSNWARHGHGDGCHLCPSCELVGECSSCGYRFRRWRAKPLM